MELELQAVVSHPEWRNFNSLMLASQICATMLSLETGLSQIQSSQWLLGWPLCNMAVILM